MSAPPEFSVRRELMNAGELQRSLERLAAQLALRHPTLAGVVLVGVQTRGVPLARRLARLAAKGGATAVGSLDITLYRDDLTTIAAQPVIRGTDIPASIDGKVVVLVDDVLYTGRTVRAALDELIDFGRPARIELLVLIDRGHRELPIRADYVGAEVETSADEIVQVRLAEEDGEDQVVVLARGVPPPSPAAAAPPRDEAPRRSRRKREPRARPRRPPRRRGRRK
jgi:pyrimidine operon attenuation protein/uracil phosphoribosyltransferase